MIVKPLDSVPKKEIDMDGAEGILKQLPISGFDGSPVFSLRVFTVGPGGHTPFHAHEWEHLNYVIEGEGVLIDADEKELHIGKGDFALVLPNERHCYKNTSTRNNLVLMCGVPKEYE